MPPFQSLNVIIFRHGKNFASLDEENHRREVWKEEMEMVDKHNKEAEVIIMMTMIMVIMMTESLLMITV